MSAVLETIGLFREDKFPVYSPRTWDVSEAALLRGASGRVFHKTDPVLGA